MKTINKLIIEELFALRDTEYKIFHSKLMPTVDPNRIIGIRTPKLRALAKALAKEKNIGEFLNTLPHYYYEENNLHAFIIQQINDADECLKAIDRFLPFIDNWATCDMLRPKCFKMSPEKLLPKIEEWISAKDTYNVRFGIEMLMVFFLDDLFKTEYLKRVAEIKSEEYYINMMCAWFFATALAKQYESTLPFIEEHRLPLWVHNKTIQKAVESYRITNGQKEYLKGLKVKTASHLS